MIGSVESLVYDFMKRIYSLIAVALTLLTAVSCVQEIVKEDQLHDAAVVYKAIADGADTRAVLGTNEAGRPQSMWENGDKITVYNGVRGYEFTTSAEDGSPVADFVYEGSDFTADNGVIAIYPAGDYETSIEGKTINVAIPYNQYAVDGSYDRNAVPAVACSKDHSLQFKNAAALLKFKVGRSDVSAVSFTSKGGEIVSGTITCSFDSDGESCEFNIGTPWVDGSNIVFLHSPESSNFEVGKTYYMSIAPNTFEYGFVIHLDAGETSVFSKEYDQSITINRNTILDLGTLGEGSDQTYSDKLYVVGTYNGWRHEYSTYLYDYSGDNATYEGVVDFNSFGLWTGIENNEFKLTGGDWGIDEHSQSEGDHYGTEPDVLSLVEGAGANINAYQEKRFYHFTFDRASNTLKKNYAFNSVGVIGSFNGWSQDVDMNYNPETQKFWVDIEFAEDSELRFRLDDSWDVSFGADDSVTRAGNENIPVSTGQYRVYLNLNNSAEVNYEFNKEAYGTEENAGGVTPWEEPEPVVGWALIGEFNNWNGDELMTEIESGLWAITGFALEASQQWKIRKDGNWNINRGAGGSLEPYYISVGEPIIAVADGKNIAVETSGVYDIYYNANDETLTVLKH